MAIDHKFGSTEIPAEPKRVACVGYVEQNALLALGIVPIATTELLGDAPGAIHPWARDALGEAALPELLSVADGIPFERIAALGPDLILAVYGNVTDRDYTRLTQIAPTVVHSADVAVGRPAQAARIATGSGGSFFGYTPPHASGELLAVLGFMVSREVAELTGDQFSRRSTASGWTCSTLTSSSS